MRHGQRSKEIQSRGAQAQKSPAKSCGAVELDLAALRSGRPLVSFTSWWRGLAVSEADVKAEIWRLGGRHYGRPLAGAIEELKAPGVTTARAILLRVCIRQMESDGRREAGASTVRTR